MTTPLFEDVRVRGDAQRTLHAWADACTEFRRAAGVIGAGLTKHVGNARHGRCLEHEVGRIVATCRMVQAIEDDARALADAWQRIYQAEMDERDAYADLHGEEAP